MTHLLVAGLAGAAAFLVWFALAREQMRRDELRLFLRNGGLR